eukprot:SAG11_NODE_662_length_7875_cov_17.557613_2_plen_76_part_00
MLCVARDPHERKTITDIASVLLPLPQWGDFGDEDVMKIKRHPEVGRADYKFLHPIIREYRAGDSRASYGAPKTMG